jgi:hypothetical protein
MGTPEPGLDVSKLQWKRLVERPWPELTELGLPSRLAEVAEEVGQGNGRDVRVYTMPTLEAGYVSLSVPFMAEDGIIIDPSLVSRVDDLAEAVAYHLALLLDPRWTEVGPGELEDRRVLATTISRLWLAD